MKKIFLVDAYALIFKFYYAFLSRPMRNPEGLNTSAIFGFTKFIRDIMKRENPHLLAVAFDPKGGSFRNELFPDYKANRSETPEDIIAAVPYIKEFLEAMRIPVLEIPGAEADDVIGTLAWKGADLGYEVYMVTPDKDFGQLIRDHVYIYKQNPKNEGIEIIGTKQVCEKYGICDPELIIDMLALWGDAADNIPGVPGVGEKSAVKLINEFGTVEEILANTDKLKGRQKENIEAFADQLRLSKRLATIETNIPVEFHEEQFEVKAPDTERLRELYHKLGFNMFLREMESEAVKTEQAAKASANETASQGSLFDMVHSVPAKSALAAAPNGGHESMYETVATTIHNYHTITDAETLGTLVDRIKAKGEICFDTETTGFDIINDKVVGISFAVEPHEAYYLPMNVPGSEAYIPLLRSVFEDGSIAKTGQNIKFDISALRRLGITLKGVKYDTMILHYLLDSESRHNMSHLARTYLGYDPVEIETLIGRGARQLTMDRVAIDIISEYAAEDADVTLRLKEILWPAVVGQGLGKLYMEIEEPLIDVLVDMEHEGVKVDASILGAYSRELTQKLNAMEAEIRAVAGMPGLNVNSARQLGEVLFDRLRIDDKPRKTKTGQYKTDEESLQALAERHPVVKMILEYRGVKKLLSTYVNALPLLINPTTGRIHTSYNQAVTATGRLSSTNPNLQNIPIRDDMGREIRKAFVPADGDHLLLSVDYSQVELRLMAHLSEDPALIEAFERGEDIHAATASRIFGIPLAEVTPEQRRRAKTANFGIIYGISAFGLSQRLNIPRKEAGELIEGYFRSYPGVKRYMERVVEQARVDGYVSTIFGRKRFIPDISSANANTRGLAERNAINAPLQGSAADIMKIAMINAHRGLESEGLKSKIILQVHDELVVDMVRSEQEQVVRIVLGAMESAAKLKVKLTADYGIGENWLEAH